MANFTIITYTNNMKSALVSDDCLSSLWARLCEKHTGKLSAKAIRALMSINVKTGNTGLTSSIADELTFPFYLCSDGAAMFPEEFQPWEADDLSFCVREKDNSFSLTFEGEAMKKIMTIAIVNLYSEFCGKFAINHKLINWSV